MILEYAPALIWSDAHRSVSSPLLISNGGLTVEYHSPTSPAEKWCSIRSDEHLGLTGVVSYEVLIDSLPAGSNGWGLAIGVVTTPCSTLVVIDPPSFCVGNKESFSFLCAAGMRCYHSGSGHDYPDPHRGSGGATTVGPTTASSGGEYGSGSGRRAATGDRVRVSIDHNNKTVEFFINGNSRGVAYRAGFDGRVLPAVAALTPAPDSEAASGTGKAKARVGSVGPIVKWPADGKFYPCVSLTIPKSKVSIEAVNG